MWVLEATDTRIEGLLRGFKGSGLGRDEGIMGWVHLATSSGGSEETGRFGLPIAQGRHVVLHYRTNGCLLGHRHRRGGLERDIHPSI